ncbi:unnamed protein product [Malus baccata var. baccata]
MATPHISSMSIFYFSIFLCFHLFPTILSSSSCIGSNGTLASVGNFSIPTIFFSPHPLFIPLFFTSTTIFSNLISRLSWKVFRACAQVVTPPPSIYVLLLARLLVGCSSHEFHLLDSCEFGICGMMEDGGIFLIFYLEASFSWIPVIARGGGGSWSAVLMAAVLRGFLFFFCLFFARSLGLGVLYWDSFCSSRLYL